LKPSRELNLDIDHAYNSANILISLRNFLQNIDLQVDDCNSRILAIINTIEEHLSSTLSFGNIKGWKLTVLGLQVLSSHLQCRDIAAKRKDGDILSEKARLEFLCDELSTSLSSIELEAANATIRDRIIRQDGRGVNAIELIDFLRLFPLHPTYFKCQAKTYSLPIEYSTNKSKDCKLPSSIVRLIAFIDNEPLVSPQLLKPQLSYSLMFSIKGILWHPESESLHVRLLSTYPSSDYSISQFILQKPHNMEEYNYEGELNGRIQFSVAQSIASTNIYFTIGCAFELSNDSFWEVPVIGYNQLEFRVIDPSNQLLFSGYRRLDSHVALLVRDLLQTNPSINDEMSELFPVIESLTCLLGIYAQGAVFKKTVTMSESDFQKEVLRDLRLRLGQEVQEHTKQAGGFTDISYRGVIIELKVEKKNGNRQHICKQYTKQPTQYEGIEARQTSIVLVLDLTEKQYPPSDIRNDIFLVNVPTHGGNDDTKKYPSKSFVFVVNGNIKDPSDYS
jgi:GTP cyclohydrolase II